jgi:putative ABC transport system permease protein
MVSVLQDVRYAARLLLRTPGFTIVAVIALALGIGANTAIFSVVNTLLLRQLPYPDPQSLVVVWEHNVPRDKKDNVVSPGNYLHWREMNRVFEQMAGISTFRTTVTGQGNPEELPVQYVNGGLLSMVGVAPERGRLFTAEDEAPNVDVAIISDRLWRQRFGADPGLPGKTIILGGVAHTVVGIMPPGFSIFASGQTSSDTRVDLWVPIGFNAASRTPRGRWMTVVARMKTGISLQQAQDDMTRVHAELTRMFPDFNTGWTARVVPLQAQLTGNIKPALLVLLGAVALVLLIACANVANLLLARASSRQRELAVRAALGADRGRLIRQLLAESMLLSALGGSTGLVLGWWTLGMLRSALADQLHMARLDAVAIDGRVLLFTLAVAMLSAVAFGLVPALSSAGGSLTTALKEGGRSATGARGARTRNLFVIVETAMALVLLVGAGLLIRSFVMLLDVNPGFDPSHTLTMKVTIPSSHYKTPDQQRAFFDDLFQRLDALPGVQAAGGISFLPLNGMGAATAFEIVGQPNPPSGQEHVADVRVVTHDYFKAMGIPLRRGRMFDLRDTGASARKVIVNETLARRHFPNEDPIGKRLVIWWNDKGEDEIVGVVGDVRDSALETEPRAMTYWPPARFAYPFMTVAIRTAGDAKATVPAAAAALHQIDSDVAAADVRTMHDVVDVSLAQRRLTMLLLAVFAGMALLLAAVGIYGVISYAVTQRTQEIGIRMALGAQRGDVLSMVVRQALVLAGTGILIGAAGAMLLTGLMRNLLFGIRPSDPVTYAVVAGVLAVVAASAASIPGFRATRVDPVIALRAE